MNQPTSLTTLSQTRQLESLFQLLREAAEAEHRLREQQAQRKAAAKSQYETDREFLVSRHRSARADLDAGYHGALETARRLFEETSQQLAGEQDAFATESVEDKQQALDSALHQKDGAKERAKQGFQNGLLEAQRRQTEALAANAERKERLERFETETEQLLRRRRCGEWSFTVDADARDAESDSPAASFDNALREAQTTVHRMRQLTSARFFEEGWPVLMFIFAPLLFIYPAGLLLSWNGWSWLIGATAAGVLLTIVTCLVLRPVARSRSRRLVPELEQAVTRARHALRTIDDQTRKAYAAQSERLILARDTERQEAQRIWETKTREITSAFDQAVAEKKAEFHKRRQSNNARWEESSREINRQFRDPVQELDRQHEEDLARLAEEFQEEQQRNASITQSEYEVLQERWNSGWQDFLAVYHAARVYCEEHFPAYRSIDWQTWTPPTSELSALCFGDYTVPLAPYRDRFPEGSQLAFPVVHLEETQGEEEPVLEMPALLSYPESPSLLLHATDAGREIAVGCLQNTMLRLLTSLPPGKVRFTIIDPVGLGQNFSAFMHLADFDERLVNNRIWTESAHINQRLLDLTEHMENVIQKYLRNEFASIQQYNRHAGEVAEPFQVLVVANFPANFSDEAARRLASIAASGARCGVYTLISTDDRLALPRNCDLGDLRAHATTLHWDPSRQSFRFHQPELADFDLELETPPPDDQFSAAVRAAGRHAQDAGRVEVPFASVAPPAERRWQHDSRAGIDVALGRAGATKLQHLRLGKGTSQHVLISGKTGSGKSTLLHALITNVALHYSPDEVELYLIDFKKGVEFKCYAQARLPHARVVAIESEREFGMSVLERLDQELRVRGDLFRTQGVQDVAGYRNAVPDARMPRILLIIDEFQEFFVKEDRIAHDASLLLDRLVRQGRAFGIHVVLGSQTLAGAYSLARSTIGQMAVRIALQCSEADAHLILSEDNTAARLLHRAGEAIYNDANGLLEGNHPFQVVWLPDHERDVLLGELRRADDAMSAAAEREPPIVFEGNAASPPDDNPSLQSLLAGSPNAIESSEAAGDTFAPSPRIWPGKSVSIQPPPEVRFDAHSGANLMIVGGSSDLALGVLGNAVLHLGLTIASDQLADSRFLILDGAAEHSPAATFWKMLGTRVPLNVQRGSVSDATSLLEKWNAELQQRLDTPPAGLAPHFLILYDLARFRELRRTDDDLGFSSFSETDASPRADRMLRDLIQQGPAVRMHTLLWCDSHKNLTRWLDRTSLRDIETRILAQMSASDSSHLMDSPVASQLGNHRAILYREERGTWEKLRPYAPPTADWIERLAGPMVQTGVE